VYSKLLTENIARNGTRGADEHRLHGVVTGSASGCRSAIPGAANAALDGKLDQVRFVKDPIFGFEVPTDAPRVPSQVLNPRDTWPDKAAYDEKASDLPGSSSTISSSSRTRLPLKCWRRRQAG